MTPFARWLVSAVVLFMLSLLSFNIWLMLAGMAILGWQVLYYGWRIINS